MVNRIRELLEARQLSPTQFADLIGVGRPVVSHILSERNKPSLEVVQKILDAFPEVSLSWLMKGTGSMLAGAAPVVPPASVPTQPAPPIPSAPAEVVTESLVAPPAIPSPALSPSYLPQPQSFMLSAAGPIAQPMGVAPPSPAARPLPPKFRPVKAVTASPSPAPSLVPTTSEPVTAVPAADILATPAAGTAGGAPSPTLQPISIAQEGFGPAALAPEHQPAPPTLQPTPAAARPEAPVAPVPSAAAPPAIAWPPPAPVESPSTNPAALSFLGEPGKAIRRIVIFYRDGSFSDYVPEGQ